MPTVESKPSLSTYKQDLNHELKNILEYWMQYALDERNGGFVGKIDNNNSIDYSAPKGSVLNARILWSFSAAYNLTGNKQYLPFAEKAYKYIKNYFLDQEFGGVYWSVDSKGNPSDTKKQIYANAFTLYAFSEYYLATKQDKVKNAAIELYHLLVEKGYDDEKTGYFEAFSKEWNEIGDLRLSAKDANEKKTMNTHLHVLEAYTTLYKIWGDEGLKVQIETLIINFLDHIIDNESNHLVLFFDENWNKKSNTVSYGHDIEAAWLLLEAAEVIKDEDLIRIVKDASVKIANAATEGLGKDGSLYYEFEPSSNHLVKEKHWWVQAEAMIGFFNAWQISNDPKYIDLSLSNWDFVKSQILDKENGEWFWGVLEDGSVMPGEDKAGLWKCPYHNSRACLEIVRRLK